MEPIPAIPSPPGLPGVSLRPLTTKDAALLVEATSGEPARSLWGGRPVGPYSLPEARAALGAWRPGTGGQFSVGALRGGRLLGAVGLLPDAPGSVELAYWVRPEERRRGLAAHAVRATTQWARGSLGVPRIWLEINPANEASLRLAERTRYHFEERAPLHCRDWAHEDAERDTWHDCLIWEYRAEG